MNPNDPFDDDEDMDLTSKLILGAMGIIAIGIGVLAFISFRP